MPSSRCSFNVVRKWTASKISSLHKAGVNCICIDFDLTLVSVHTRGYWQGNAQELVRFIRPFFKEFIFACIQAGIKVAVVTASPQQDLIAKVVGISFPNMKVGVIGANEAAAVLPACVAEFLDVTKMGNSLNQSTLSGKIKHCCAVVQLLNTTARSAAKISRESLLLIDDDHRNTNNAQRHGIRALCFQVECTKKAACSSYHPFSDSQQPYPSPEVLERNTPFEAFELMQSQLESLHMMKSPTVVHFPSDFDDTDIVMKLPSKIRRLNTAHLSPRSSATNVIDSTGISCF